MAAAQVDVHYDVVPSVKLAWATQQQPGAYTAGSGISPKRYMSQLVGKVSPHCAAPAADQPSPYAGPAHSSGTAGRVSCAGAHLWPLWRLGRSLAGVAAGSSRSTAQACKGGFRASCLKCYSVRGASHGACSLRDMVTVIAAEMSPVYRYLVHQRWAACMLAWP